MNRIALLARREATELARQPAMLGAITALFTAIVILLLAALGLLQVLSSIEPAAQDVASWLDALGLEGVRIPELTGLVLTTGAFLIFTQYLGISGVLAGHTILHDRQCGTLPFLLLAPITRAEILLGKVLGALVPPTLLYGASQALVMGIAASLPVAKPHAAILPPSPGWLVSALLGGPAWAFGVAVLCAIVSALARDVRAAQQGVWLVMFFATTLAGYLLAGRLADGALVQLGVALAGAALGAGAVYVGARIISRDLGR
jgi:hypothetical protein